MTRIRNINELRGLACILLVAYHISEINIGAQWFQNIQTGLIVLRMPMFTIISGFVYSMRPCTREFLDDFFIKKVRRIVIPFMVLTTVVWIARHGHHPEETSLLFVMATRYQQFWFLQALIGIFIIVGFIDAFGIPQWVKVVISLGMLLHPLPAMYFNVDGMFYLFPFFVFGNILLHHQDWINQFRFPSIVVAGVVMIMRTHDLLDPFVGLLGGVAGFIAIAGILPNSTFLSRIGKVSYPIYLWHDLTIESAHVILSKLHTGSAEQFFVLEILGIGIPIFLWWMFGKYSIAWLMFGQRSKLSSKASV